jgi:hypothetical protein
MWARIERQEDVVQTLSWRATPDVFGHTVDVANGKRAPFQLWPHVQYIGSRIAKAVASGKGRLLVNIPPGHGKSTLISFWTPIWLLDNLPQRRIICASHGAELAHQWGRLVRNEFEHNPVLTTELREDLQAANRWNTHEGGGMVSVGVGGGITGFRGDLLLFDDPYATWEDAYSHTMRNKVQAWFDGTFYDRGEPNATIIVIGHRWHDDDLFGYLSSKHTDPWEIVRLPALAEAGDPLGRSLGAALCPARFPRADLEQTRRANVMVFSAKYQQNPQGIGTERVYDRHVQLEHEDKTLTFDLKRGLDLSFDFNRNPGMHVEAGQHFLDRDLYTCVREFHGPFLKLTPALDMVSAWLAEEYGFASPDDAGQTWYVELIKAGKKLSDAKFPFPVVEFFADATGNQDRAETTETAIDMVINYARKRRWPLRVRIPVDNPPQRSRVDTFNQCLKDDDGDIHYKYHPRCERLRADFKELKTDPQGLIDKEDDKLSHATDAEGYRIHYLRPIRQRTDQRKAAARPPRTIVVAGSR